MSEINNRKRKHSLENSSNDCKENTCKRQSANENEPHFKVPVNCCGKQRKDSSIGKSIDGDKHTFRSGQVSQTLNENKRQNTTCSSEPDKETPAKAQPQKRKRTLQKYYTLKLRKLKDKFKTQCSIRGGRSRRPARYSSANNRSRKDLNQSKMQSNKQAKLLDKLLEKHNKYLESL